MDKIEKNLLKQIADIEKTPMGAYNIRENGKGIARNTTANIDIVTKKDKPGIDIIIKPNTKNESVHIPVIITIMPPLIQRFAGRYLAVRNTSHTPVMRMTLIILPFLKPSTSPD